jgi:hypothetical protein
MEILWKALNAFLQARVPLAVLTFVGMVGIWGLAGIHFALAEGLVPSLFPGYCHMDVGCPTTVQAVQGLQRAGLRASMRENHEIMCKAEPREQGRYQEYIDQDQEVYRSLNQGDDYNLRMDCQT